MSTHDDLLTVAEAVKISGFSEATIRRHIEKGALPIVRRGPFRRIRIRRDELERYLTPPDETPLGLMRPHE